MSYIVIELMQECNNLKKVNTLSSNVFLSNLSIWINMFNMFRKMFSMRTARRVH
jgi:hypothetical protein